MRARHHRTARTAGKLLAAAAPLFLTAGLQASPQWHAEWYVEAAGAPDPASTAAPIPETEDEAGPAIPAFLDAPDPALADAYDRNADSDDPRDWRLYGELLLSQGDGEGFSYVDRAARKGDARACYIVAEALAYGLWGQEQDYTLAMKWLHTAMSADYAPAYELMAALAWDGDWNCLRNTHDAVWYLDKAIAGYTAGDVPDPALGGKLKAYVKSLRALRDAMNQTKDYNWEKIGEQIPQLKGFTPSFLQLRLSTFPDITEAGLRQRATYIQAFMEQRRGKSKLGKLAPVRLEFIPISVSDATDVNGIAKTTWKATDTTFSAQVEIHTAALPPLPGMLDPEVEALRKEAVRLVVVNDALAHELAHVYFCSRYPKLADFSSGDARMTYEGHATNAAYEFTNATFFHGRLSPERYADFFLTDEYREYFFWFRENCLSPASLVYWEILDRWERNSGERGYRAHNRKQDTSGTPAATPLQLFGKAFQGYM